MRWIAKVKIIKREKKKKTHKKDFQEKSNVAKDQKMTSKITF